MSLSKWLGDFKTLKDPLPELVKLCDFVLFGKVIKSKHCANLSTHENPSSLCLQQKPGSPVITIVPAKTTGGVTTTGSPTDWMLSISVDMCAR